MDIHDSRDEATKRSFTLENSGTRFKGQVSSVTWRECNVIAVRSTKKGTSRLDVYVRFLVPHRSRRNLLVVQHDRKMHGNVYEGRVESAYLLAARSRSNVQQ